jgi:hypothetical protein
MIYLQQDFDLDTASPVTRDRFVELATDAIVRAGIASGRDSSAHGSTTSPGTRR